MGKHRRTTQEKNVIALEGAILMVECDLVLWDLSHELNVPMSSLYKIMMDRLPHLNAGLFDRVRDRLEDHKKTGRRKYRGTMSV